MGACGGSEDQESLEKSEARREAARVREEAAHAKQQAEQKRVVEQQRLAKRRLMRFKFRRITFEHVLATSKSHQLRKDARVAVEARVQSGDDCATS